jgi:hypothetical protein
MDFPIQKSTIWSGEAGLERQRLRSTQRLQRHNGTKVDQCGKGYDSM